MKRKPTVLGMLFKDSDPSAALIVDGRIAAFAEEERFRREKHCVGKFPLHSARYCLSEAGLDIRQVDVVAVGWDAPKFPLHMARFFLESWYKYKPSSRFVLDWQLHNLTRHTAESLEAEIRENLLEAVPPQEWPDLRFVNHHFAHACSCYLVSGFDDAAILTADGHGEDDCVNYWKGENGRIDHLRQWKLPHSLGWYYTKFTQWFGFRPHDGEGKLMGLAAYGKPVPELLENVHKVVNLTNDDNVFEVGTRFFYGDFVRDKAYTREWLDLFGEPRPLESKEPFTDYHKDLAFAVQHVLEEICLALVEDVLKTTGARKLCVAGGTFMNCKLNGIIARRIGLENFFVQPVAGDNGIALGTALAVYQQDGIPWTATFDHLYHGPAFGNEEIESELARGGLSFTRSENISRDAARLVAGNRVVGWFQGRMEAGARALGNRSILGNPLHPEMSDRINRKVKFREPWRPFCPATTSEEGSRHFDQNGELPFMIVATWARPGIAEKLPSVVHVDNSVRVQTVKPSTNRRFYDLIEAFRELTGVGVVLNTSFNVKGEPIVCSPRDAVQCFLKTGMDALAIGDFLVVKENE